MAAARNERQGRYPFAVVAALICLLAAPMLIAQDVRSRVEQILNSPRSSGGLVQQLVQLGAPAVPVLAEQLRTYPFPMIILDAMGRIGDPSATAAVLAFLDRVCVDAERQEECLMAIGVLRELGDTRAEPTLHLLLTRESHSPVAIRLAAASALAKWGSPGVRQEASEFILETARNWRPEINSRADILDDALAALGTEEGQTVLTARLSSAGLATEQSRIIRLLSRQPTPQAAASWLAFCEREDRDAYVRLAAAKALLDSGVDFPQDRLSAALERISKALPIELRPQAEQLQKRLTRPR